MVAIPTLGHRFILKEIIFICCGLVLVIVGQDDYGDYGSEDSDYYGEYEDDYDMCNYHGSLPESHACHKDNLPKETMEDLFGENVKKCCKVHGYEETISTLCEVSSKPII